MRHYKLVLVLSFTLVLSVGLITQTNVSTGFIPSQIDSTLIERNMAPAAINIEITAESHFADEGFTGAGSEGNPYVLDGAVINVASGDTGIQIMGTYSHFVIQNCIFTGDINADRAVYLYQADNGTIANCTFQGDFDYGIYVYDSKDLKIQNNEIEECSVGIYLDTALRVGIESNKIIDSTFFAIHEVGNGANVTIENNWIHRVNYNTGFSTARAIITNSDNTSIIMNDIRSVDGHGISVEGGQNIEIQQNRIWNITDFAMRVLSADTIDISFNNISCSDSYGIVINSVIGSHVHNNTIYHSGTGAISVAISDNGLYYGNKISSCTFGIIMGSTAHNNRIYDNKIGWCGSANGYDDAGVTYNDWGWTYGNWYHDYVSGTYTIDGTAGRTDTNPQTLTDSTTPTIERPGASFEFWDTDTDIWLTWQASDDFPQYWYLYINSSYDSMADWCNDSISLSLDDYPVGNYEIEMRVSDWYGHVTYADIVNVTIMEDDITSPDIIPHSDFSVEAFYDSFQIDWTVYDSHPDTFEIYNNGSLLRDDPYSNGSLCWWSPSHSGEYLGKGLHNFTILTNDTFGNTATSITWVTVVDTTVPTINSFTSDHEMEYGEDYLVVTADMDDYYPDRRIVWLDNVNVQSLNGTWSNGPVSYHLPYDHLGEYNVTIVFTDEDGNSNQGTCIITVVDTTNPVLNAPPDVYMEYGSTGNWANWSIDELLLDHFDVWINEEFNGTHDYSFDWLNATADGFDVGEYNITIIFYDTTGNSAKDTVWVFVSDSVAPEIIGYGPYDGESGELSNVQWYWNEEFPQNYTIFENGTLMVFSETVDEPIEYYVNHLGPGLWNITLLLYDESGNFDIDNTWVTLHDTTGFPGISFTVSSNTYELGQETLLNWTIHGIRSWDQPGTWFIFSNGSQVATGVWDTVFIQRITILADVGRHNFTLKVVDQYGNPGTNSIWITIRDWTIPTISSPIDVEFTEGETGKLIAWTGSDLDPSWYNVTKDGVVILEGPWTGQAINVDVSANTLGTYTYVLTIVDASGNTNSDSVTVTVTAAGTTTTTTTTTNTTDVPTGDGGVMVIAIAIGVVGAIIVILVLFVLPKMKK